MYLVKRKIKKVPKRSITYKNTQMKQHSTVAYVSFVLDETITGESMTLKIINEINWRLKFLHQENKLLGNALIHPHFD